MKHGWRLEPAMEGVWKNSLEICRLEIQINLLYFSETHNRRSLVGFLTHEFD